tara:strand:- start:1721 stop:2905 length:1185 start_codon:yes stop_codon:yes gene_type:complete
MPKKILIITPRFPIPTDGACEQDRLAGILQLKRLGFKVRVISKVFDWQNQEEILNWGRENDIIIDLIPYEKKSFIQKILQLINPINWDGAAYEYRIKNTQHTVKKVMNEFQPDVAWFDYTYLYPLYHLFQEKNIPIITRSINVEPSHFLQEDGASILNLIKYFPKWYSEMQTIKKSNYVFAITPEEQVVYKKLRAKNVDTLALRSLPKLVKQNREIQERDVLHLFFMGAGYNVNHNRKAAELIIKHVAPELEKQKPGKFVFHILGKKLPQDLSKLCKGNVIEEGFVDDLDSFLQKMDIAVIPSLMGAGMQQKIFEPLVYGIPSVVSGRGLAGYPYKDGEHALFASEKDEFVEQILKLQDIDKRRKLSKNALQLSKDLFSQEGLDQIITKGLNLI